MGIWQAQLLRWPLRIQVKLLESKHPLHRKSKMIIFKVFKGL